MLNQLLEKLGIHNYEQLTAEERKTYQEWGQILSAPEVSLDDVKKLLTSESKRAAEEIRKFENSKDRQLFFQALARLTDTLTLFLDTPAASREALKAHLKQTFKVEI
jgi:hypothetical protein